MALLEVSWKLIQKHRQDRIEMTWLFDVDSAPDEFDNLAGDQPVVAGYLAAALERQLLAQGFAPEEA